MKKLFIFSALLIAAFTSCDPIENRDEMTGAITAEQLDVTATPVVVNGKNSNKIIMENHSPVLSHWDYGMGISTRAYQEVLLVLAGSNTIMFTGINPDGTYVTKDLTVQIDELSFEVPKEWGLFCGTGEKVWTWNEEAGSVYGMSGTGDDIPGWWTPAPESQISGDGIGATMTFSIRGAKLTKTKTDGTTEIGTFDFDMSYKNSRWSRPIGLLSTKNTTVLAGKDTGGDGGLVYDYEILSLTEEELLLGKLVPEGAEGSQPDAEGWGQATLWLFKAK